jgi:hypothetical protein
MEKFPSQDIGVENKEKDPKKKRWGKLKTIVLAGSLLVNGGFVAEGLYEQGQISNLAKGEKQTFSIDYPKNYERTAGQRGEFSLQKTPDGRWNLVGTISVYEKTAEGSDIVRTVHEVNYELPPLTSGAAEALLRDMEHASQPNTPGDIGVFMNRIIESSEKGTITYYNPDSHRVEETLELNALTGIVTSKHFDGRKIDANGGARLDEASTYTMTTQELDQRVDFHDKAN